jgi:hypothetical protein
MKRRSNYWIEKYDLKDMDPPYKIHKGWAIMDCSLDVVFSLKTRIKARRLLKAIKENLD